MEPRSLKYLSEACGGELRHGSPERLATSICTDSRQAGPGDLFIALSGENFDAHDFLPAVSKTGVIAVLAERNKIPAEYATTAIAVNDTRAALGKLAARYRQDFDLPIIAVGGSNGKTTTKELIATVLRQKFSTLWSEASFNNDIGVPLTLLKLQSEHQIAVLEAGTNHPGELAPLLQQIKPRFGVLTNIGREHLEFFLNIEGVVKEEGSLAEILPKEGTLFVTGDNEFIEPILRRTRAKIVRVGFGAHNQFVARDVQFKSGEVSFFCDAPSPELSGEYRLKLLGRHQVTNALLALAVAGEVGLSRAQIQTGLRECQPAKRRLELSSVNGFEILDDSYNANADSMFAALQTLRDLPCRGRRVAVLGDMAELGEETISAHAEVGRRAAECEVAHLFTVGKHAAITAAAARSAGLRNVNEISEVLSAAEALKKFLLPGDLVLLKASRSLRIERIAERLRH
ncbi:MAG: UDP-N-acetylmuramoyl-tripeptide--D-alanyl-D-alanine ligase [Verrucomicrobiota bacterium]